MAFSPANTVMWAAGVVLWILPHLNLALLSDYKICGDSECESLMSRVRAIKDNSGKDCRFLSFKRGQTIFVYHKLTGKRDDLWAGSMDKEFGHFPKDAVIEEQVLNTVEKVVETQESDFFCVDAYGDIIDSSHLDSDDDKDDDDDDQRIQNREPETTQTPLFTDDTNTQSPSTSADPFTEPLAPAQEVKGAPAKEDRSENAVDSAAGPQVEEAPEGPNEQGGSAPSAWLGSSVTGWLGLSNEGELVNRGVGEKQDDKMDPQGDPSVTSSVKGWLGFGGEGEKPSEAVKSSTQDGETAESYASTVGGWLGFGAAEKEDLPEKETDGDGNQEKEEEQEPTETFRSRRMSLDLEGSQLHEEEREEPTGTLGWLGNGLSSTLGFGRTNRESEAEEAVPKGEEPPSSGSWLDVGIGDILGYGQKETVEGTGSGFEETGEDNTSAQPTEITDANQSQAALTEEESTTSGNEPIVGETPKYSTLTEDAASVLDSVSQTSSEEVREDHTLDVDKREANVSDQLISAGMEGKDQDTPKSIGNEGEDSSREPREGVETAKDSDQEMLSQSNIKSGPDFTSVDSDSNSEGRSAGEVEEVEEANMEKVMVEERAVTQNQTDESRGTSGQSNGDGDEHKEGGNEAETDVPHREISEDMSTEGESLSSSQERKEPNPVRDDTLTAHSVDVNHSETGSLIDTNTELSEGEMVHPVQENFQAFGSSQPTSGGSEVESEEPSFETTSSATKAAGVAKSEGEGEQRTMEEEEEREQAVDEIKDEEKPGEVQGLKEEEKKEGELEYLKEFDQKEEEEVAQLMEEKNLEEIQELKEEESEDLAKLDEEEKGQEEGKIRGEEKDQEVELLKEEKEGLAKSKEQEEEKEEGEIKAEEVEEFKEEEKTVEIVEVKAEGKAEDIKESDKEEEKDMGELEGEEKQEEGEKLEQEERQRQTETLTEEKQEEVEEVEQDGNREESKEAEEVKERSQSSHLEVQMENTDRPESGGSQTDTNHEKALPSTQTETRETEEEKREEEEKNEEEVEEAKDELQEEEDEEGERKDMEEEGGPEALLRDRDGSHYVERPSSVDDRAIEAAKPNPMDARDQVLTDGTGGSQRVYDEGTEDQNQKKSDPSTGNQDVNSNNVSAATHETDFPNDNLLHQADEATPKDTETGSIWTSPQKETEQIYSESDRKADTQDDIDREYGKTTAEHGLDLTVNKDAEAPVTVKELYKVNSELRSEGGDKVPVSPGDSAESQAMISEEMVLQHPTGPPLLSDSEGTAEVESGGPFGLFQNPFGFFSQKPAPQPNPEPLESAPDMDSSAGEEFKAPASLTPESKPDSATDPSQDSDADPPIDQQPLPSPPPPIQTTPPSPVQSHPHPGSPSPSTESPLRANTLSKQYKNLLAYMSADDATILQELFGRHKLQFLDFILERSETATEDPDDDESILLDVERLLNHHMEALLAPVAKPSDTPQEDKDKTRALVALQKLETLIDGVRETFSKRKSDFSNAHHQAEASCVGESCSAPSQEKDTDTDRESSMTGEPSLGPDTNTLRDGWMSVDGKERVTDGEIGGGKEHTSEGERVLPGSRPHAQPGRPRPAEGTDDLSIPGLKDD